MRIQLDANDVVALASALSNYLDGEGMPEGDEDEATLEAILADLEATR